MLGLIHFIERHRIPYLVSLSLLYLLFLSTSLFDPAFLRNSTILHIAFIFLFSLYNRRVGFLAAGLSISFLVTVGSLGIAFTELPGAPVLFHLGGAVISLLVAYAAGTMKQLYLDRLEAQRRVEESKVQYQKVVDNIKEGMIIVDRNGVITFKNWAAEDILGIPYTKIGDNILDKLDEDNRTVLQREMEKRGSGRASEYELDYYHPLKGMRRLYVAATPYTDAEGRITGSIGFVNDITDFNSSEAKIEALQKRNDYLLSEMQHRAGNGIALTQAFINLYLEDESIGKRESLRGVDDILDTLAILSQRFYRSFDRHTLDLRHFLEELIAEFAQKYRIDAGCIRTELESTEVYLNTALPLGVLLSLVVPTIFISSGNGEAGEPVHISLRVRESERRVEVQSRALSRLQWFSSGNGSGTQGEVVEALARQFKGHISVKTEGAEELSIVF